MSYEEKLLHSHWIGDKAYRLIKTPNYFRIDFVNLMDKNSYRCYTFVGLYETLECASVVLASIVGVSND